MIYLNECAKYYVRFWVSPLMESRQCYCNSYAQVLIMAVDTDGNEKKAATNGITRVIDGTK